MTKRRKSRPRHSVRRQGAVDPATSLVPPGYLHPDEYTEEQLHWRLVDDAVHGIATPLAWCVAAYTRIGKLNGRGPEAAYQDVRADFKARTMGIVNMPLA